MCISHYDDTNLVMQLYKARNPQSHNYNPVMLSSSNEDGEDEDQLFQEDSDADYESVLSISKNSVIKFFIVGMIHVFCPTNRM